MNALRPVIASLVAPFAALLPPLLLAAYELNASVVLINGEADDAPQRALGLLLVGLPVFYVGTGCFCRWLDVHPHWPRITSEVRFGSIGTCCSAGGPFRLGWQQPSSVRSARPCSRARSVRRGLPSHGSAGSSVLVGRREMQSNFSFQRTAFGGR